MGKEIKAIRGAFFDFVDDPWKHAGNEEQSARFYGDGMLVFEDGIILAYGSYDEVSKKYPNVEITHLAQRLILPGFIDGHVHMAQTRVLGSYGHQLLDWLVRWVFTERAKYSDAAYAQEGAKHFFDNLLANGTTTAQAFLTHSPVCAEAFFEEAVRRNMRMIGGLTGMDRFAPPTNIISAGDFYEHSKRLLLKYHRKGRSLYAITPRFPIGSTQELLAACQRLKKNIRMLGSTLISMKIQPRSA